MSEGRCVSAGGKGSGWGSRAGRALLLALACLMCISCAEVKRKKAVTKFAEEQYRSLSKNDAELRDHTGLKQVRLFGRDMAGFANQLKMEKSKTATDTYAVHVPFWCEGIDGKGGVVRKRCQLNFSVRVGPDGKAFSEEATAWDDQGALTFTRQFWTWVGVVLGVMAIVVFFGAGNSEEVFVRGTIAWVLLLPIAGYAARVCFGSWPAVAVCLVTLAPPYAWATARITGSAWAGNVGGVMGMVVVWAIFMAGGGWLLWKVVPYVARGTMGWFQWLFGHF